LERIQAVAKKYVMFMEFSVKEVNTALAINFMDHYWAYDYSSYLKKFGFGNIKVEKIPEKFWPIDLWVMYGHIITAEKLR
jgi:hypothetical protein